MKLYMTFLKLQSGSFIIHDSAESWLPFDRREILSCYPDATTTSDLPRMCSGIPQALDNESYTNLFFSKLNTR